jgi:type 1 fimbriae regulatory protein FimB
MLRHACGLALADQGADTRPIQGYLGHSNMPHTLRYTATNPARLEKKLWRKVCSFPCPYRSAACDLVPVG